MNKKNYTKQKSDINVPNKISKVKIIFILVFIFLLMIALLVRVGYLQIVQGEQLKTEATSRQTSTETLPAKRGNIYDSKGKTLASSYDIDKGVKLTNAEIVKEVLGNIKEVKWIIYHTRLASVGNINDRNCHPFEDNGRVMAMNGTERRYNVVNKNLTDTENILLSTKDILNGTKKYNSVFLGYENGKVFASSFPAEYYVNDIVYDAPQNFVEGKKMNLVKPSTEKRYFDFGAYGIYEW